MNKLNNSYQLLSDALSQYSKDSNNKVLIAAVIKTFEIAFEYTWKAFKKLGIEDGREIYPWTII